MMDEVMKKGRGEVDAGGAASDAWASMHAPFLRSNA